MAAMKTSSTALDDNTTWRNFAGFDDLYFHVLDVDHERSLVDMLMKFDPNATCVPHCHVGPTRTLVVEGEHIIYQADADGVRTDPRAKEESRRPAGSFSTNNGDETHVEGAGPDGAVILLSMTAVDGNVYEIFNDDLSHQRMITIENFQRGLDRQRAMASTGGTEDGTKDRA
ncbi:MAG: 2,4'-dihydroxyacetophenone dioxygenase [Candidatus Poriferisodalaceae bacterium]|jgi:2,4'-dihydroxyacetophenone dioxygenase